MSSSDRSVGSRSRRSGEHFREERLVRIAPGAFAIGFDPFGMLDSQIMVNLLLEIRRLSARYARTINAAEIEADLRVVFYIEGDIVVTVDVGSHDLYRG